MSEKTEPTQNVKLSRLKKSKMNIFQNKFDMFNKIITNTTLSIQKYKLLTIYNSNDFNNCLDILSTLAENLNSYKKYLKNNSKAADDLIISKLQEINNELSILFKNYGTQNLEDLLIVCFGQDYINNTKINTCPKYELLKSYAHPISYKVINWTNSPTQSPKTTNSIVEDLVILENSSNLDCFDLINTSTNFTSQVFGVKIIFQNADQKKAIICHALVDSVFLNSINSVFIDEKLSDINLNIPDDTQFHNDTFNRFVEMITLKDLLIYNFNNIYEKYVGCLNQLALLKQKTIDQVVKDFLSGDIYSQRKTILLLILSKECVENHYLAYLLYDLLSNDTNGIIDTREQSLILDSFAWPAKKYFKFAMKQTIEYSYNLNNNNNAIPLEQQICLLKTSDLIKEKAMVKLKEVNAKSDDTGSKARQYLEGLIKIPFNIYKDEPILSVSDDILQLFKNIGDDLKTFPAYAALSFNEITIVEVQNFIINYKTQINENIYMPIIQKIKNHISHEKRPEIIKLIEQINVFVKANNYSYSKIPHSGKKIDHMRENINVLIQHYIDDRHIIGFIASLTNTSHLFEKFVKITTHMELINKQKNTIRNYISNMESTLNDSVYGHDFAKNQIKRLIGQWINGKSGGYCLGFEGPPGVGKTTLAKKGIGNCLIDDNGVSRPFGFIAIGGSANGSTLDGHNYTYVGSTWGRIVDILIESKCMNPIIFIDELDKISKTEHGKEIIGILTHLTDSTQNDSFNDKYFSGIDLDLSKVLIIFSYNDPEQIDRILLDRIHRIKFKQLALIEKITICNDYLLPQIYEDMGLQNQVIIYDDILEFIIESYTMEPGVRKLKEILYEIIGEINLKILYNTEYIEIPIKITTEEVQFIYLTERSKIMKKKIHKANSIGLITGLWANGIGMGGILPIEAKFYPTKTFLDFKLTGMQGDVMKESMAVAKTLAWSQLTATVATALIKKITRTQNQGIHIHVPEGATPKDGPSAGTAITVVLYSLFMGIKIKHNVAITGEMCLQGKVTAIGGLNLKILGGIKAGVTEFLFPKENEPDFNKFMEKEENKLISKGIKFHMIETIQEALALVLED